MPPRTDDASISDETVLWRRVFPTTDFQGNLTLTSFDFRAPKDELSMDVSTETTREAVLARGLAGQTIVGLKAGFLRGLDYIIVRDPEPDNPAHVLVMPKPGKTDNQKRKDRKAMALEAIPY
jgi:hypothetical protein